MEPARLGPYRLGRRLAAGGMAEVFAATREGAAGFEKQVALKRILPHLVDDPELVEMFLDEARLASKLTHANVAQVFDFGEADGSFFIVMEWIRGKDLRRVMRAAAEAGVAVTPVQAALVGQGVARALACAHGLEDDHGRPLGLVHRDVSPQNVLVSFDGEVKLTDFGIAKIATGRSRTAVGVIKGKCAYMSPEQARGEALDGRTDLFALGVVLWELLAGQPLFTGRSDPEILRAVERFEAPPLQSVRPEVPADLEAVVVRALGKDPAGRFATAGRMAAALGDVVLAHAGSSEALDLGALMRRLFPEEAAGRRPDRAAAATRGRGRRRGGRRRARRRRPAAAVGAHAPGARRHPGRGPAGERGAGLTPELRDRGAGGRRRRSRARRRPAPPALAHPGAPLRRRPPRRRHHLGPRPRRAGVAGCRVPQRGAPAAAAAFGPRPTMPAPRRPAPRPTPRGNRRHPPPEACLGLAPPRPPRPTGAGDVPLTGGRIPGALAAGPRDPPPATHAPAAAAPPPTPAVQVLGPAPAPRPTPPPRRRPPPPRGHPPRRPPRRRGQLHRPAAGQRAPRPLGDPRRPRHPARGTRLLGRATAAGDRLAVRFTRVILPGGAGHPLKGTALGADGRAGLPVPDAVTETGGPGSRPPRRHRPLGPPRHGLEPPHHPGAMTGT